MATIEVSVVIDRTVEEVFDFVANPENESQWNPGIAHEITSEGPLGVGTTGRTVSRFLGQTFESTWEVTEYEVNRKKTVKSTSGFPFEGVEVYESVNGGTRLTLTARSELGGFLRLVEPIFIRLAKRQGEKNYANLKELLEARGQTS